MVSRQHAIPFAVRKFAGEQQINFTGQRGRGRSNVPTLCDIYHQLTIEGLAVVAESDIWFVNTNPEFHEIGNPDNCVMARIKFDKQVDGQLRELKKAIDGGAFPVVSGEGYRRNVSEISLISVAVNLMMLAMYARTGKRVGQFGRKEIGDHSPSETSRKSKQSSGTGYPVW